MATVIDKTAQERRKERHAFVQAVHGVRYQVKDVARSAAFYTTHLGFTLEHQQLPAFASVSFGDAQILLSGPQASGSRPLPNGQQQEPSVLHPTLLIASTAAYTAARPWRQCPADSLRVTKPNIPAHNRSCHDQLPAIDPAGKPGAAHPRRRDRHPR